MSIRYKTKALLRQILQPAVTTAIQRVRGGRQSTKPRLVKVKNYSVPQEASILRQAREHLEDANRLGHERMPPSKRWWATLERMRGDANRLTAAREVIYYAQSRMGFDGRAPAVAKLPYFQLYDELLKMEFPHFHDVIDEVGDSPYSRADTLVEYRGRLVSNIMFRHLRYVLQCLTHIKEPEVVCEIGGGYGGPARLWLQNPIHRPSTYVLIDFPESLFFAEVFLQANIDDLNLLNVTGPAPLDADVLAEYSVILCPINCIEALASLSLILVVNTGSLQEMTEEWVDFWMEWLKNQDSRYFYSMNYFAQPLAYMAEAANTWSPRLTPDWEVRFQRFDPTFQKLHTSRSFAEILAEKPPTKPAIAQQALSTQYELTKHRIMDGNTLLEAMDIVRMHPDEEIMWDLLQRCVSEMRTIPKEAYYLAEYLDKHASPNFREQNDRKLRDLHLNLRRIRSSGKEDVHKDG